MGVKGVEDMPPAGTAEAALTALRGMLWWEMGARTLNAVLLGGEESAGRLA
jgi:hypothetical protein